MKVEVRRLDLVDALKNCVLIAPKSCTDPILHNVKIVTENDRLSIGVTDYEQYYSESIVADVTEPGEILVNASKLYAIVRKMRTDTISIEVTPQNWFYITSGKLKTRIPGANPELLSMIDFKKPPFVFSLEPKELKDLFDKTFPFIGQNESRRNLMGLHMETRDGYHVFTGADAFRIAELKKIGQNEYKCNAILPGPSFANVAKIFSRDISYWHTDGVNIKINSENQVYQSRAIEAEFPNLQRLLNPKECEATAKTKDLIDAFDMMKVITESDANTVAKITLNSALSLESQKLEFGEGKTEIDCDYEGPEFAAGINIKFFSGIVSVFKKAEEIKIGVAAGSKSDEVPIMMISEAYDNYKTIIMPVKIKW